MHLLQNRDHLVRHLDDLDRRDVELHQLMDLNCDMDLKMQVHLLHLDVVQNLDVPDRQHLLDVEHLDAQQNLDVEHLVVEHLDVLRPLVAEVDVELRHQLRTDYFLDVVGVELRHLQRMDYFQDVVQLAHQELVELLELEQQEHLELQHVQQLLPVLLHVMP
jgi:hypothetical protein